ncbi:hypothetical protein ZIOFF_038446 [Zingiber officinale]|uniref:Uncharacterized protein n=1 Tax=Zingiber officinale TaxID=94328 RepID=A0A8J5G9W0_ZINOF|nr:hypothetical protein ZIOFF_038446 [Zingiber officinale]
MDAPGKRKSREDEVHDEPEAIKRQTIPNVLDEEGDSGSLPGLAVYTGIDDEEITGRREQSSGQDNGGYEPGNRGGETNENGGGLVAWDGGDDVEEEGEDQKDGSRFMEPVRRQRQVERRRDCPYLDTVNRQVLDFDFEKFCSISLSNLNVYACLVCGKYYQGRGLNSHAYTHSLEAGHHVYINLQTEKVYCLPDGYEIDDSSLDDIRHVLNPRFSREQVLHLDENRQWSRALDGSNYLPGMVGLNNIKETDFVNVTIQSLMRVTPLRNFFLIPENYQHSKSPLIHRFGELTRKIWHARNFKGQVSPHEFLQAVMKASNKRFQIGVQSDPVEFMSWLLNILHTQLRLSKKKDRSIIYDCFQGELEVVKEMPKKSIADKLDNEDEQNKNSFTEGGLPDDNIVRETSKVSFLMLGLDLPPPPLFKDAMEKNIIPQFRKWKTTGSEIARLVNKGKLIWHVIFVVNFPVKNLELKDYIPLPPPKDKRKLRSKYDLIGNIVHDGKPGEGYYRVFVQRKSEELWYEMQDLHVTETLPQMVALSEAYMQIYEQQG